MSSMIIPGPVQVGAKKLRDLTDNQAKELLAALTEAAPSVDRPTLASQITSRISAIENKDVRDIIRTLLSFYTYRHAFGRTLPEVVDNILTSDDLGLNEEEQTCFSERLTAFMNDIESLTITAKASDLLYARERILMDAKIITDIRPVFKETSFDIPAAGMVTQTLHLTYLENLKSERQEIFFAIDASDIDNLRKVLDRAERKAKGLTNMIQNAGVTYLEETNES